MSGRPRKLKKEIADVLQTRVFIAKTTQVISQSEIAEGFEIGIKTLRRYTSEKEREYSRALAAIQYQKYKAIDTSICSYCEGKVRYHVKCKDCKILLHPLMTERHGGSVDMVRCHSCDRAKLRGANVREWPTERQLEKAMYRSKHNHGSTD